MRRSLQKSLSSRSCRAGGRAGWAHNLWEDGISPGRQHSSVGEGAAGVSLGHMEGVLGRVQVEVGKEEVDEREKHGMEQSEEQRKNRR